jgi:pimeloyl-ACP methyl ester carboxylesterase
MINAPTQTDANQGFVDVRGVPHYYEWIRQPSGNLPKPVMVFVHGWGGSARYWESTAAALCDRFDCLLYDLRGFGRSRLPDQANDQASNLGYEMEDYADDLAILLQNLGLNSVIIHSHSMGASIAACFLVQYPQLAERAILTCNGIFEYDEKAFAAFHMFGGYVVKFRYPWFSRVPLADRLFMARFLVRSIPARDRRNFLEDFIVADYEAAVGTIYTSVSKNAVEVMPKVFAGIETPTLLISGQKDQIIPSEMGRLAASLNPRLDYFEMPQTGHFPMLEDAPTYLSLVRDFLVEY